MIKVQYCLDTEVDTARALDQTCNRWERKWSMHFKGNILTFSWSTLAKSRKT